MKNIKTYPILLAGGSGTRLWPVSREFHPKQLGHFFKGNSFIRQTVQRLLPITESANIRIVCQEKHAWATTKELKGLEGLHENILITEPCGRNTGPALLLAVLNILQDTKDAIILLFPADHVIEDHQNFQIAVHQAQKIAELSHIVMFGIKPAYPETGYGYIEAYQQDRIESAYPIKRFVEKPDLKTAKTYLRAGNFFWNSGMFAFKASLILEEFRTWQPAMLTSMQALEQPPQLQKYELINNISIDYAIMEKTTKGVVLPVDFGWSDIGSWKSLYDFMPKDQNENVITGDVILQDTKKSLVMAQERLIAINQLENVVVVESPDAVFVSSLENSREVQGIVKNLKVQNRPEYCFHNIIYHPWGYCKELEDSEDFKVSRILIYPEKEMVQISSSETVNWFVSGPARILMPTETIDLEKPGTILIPPGTQVRVINLGKSNLQILEIKP